MADAYIYQLSNYITLSYYSLFKLLIPLKNLTLIFRVFKIKNEMEDDQMIDCSVGLRLSGNISANQRPQIGMDDKLK